MYFYSQTEIRNAYEFVPKATYFSLYSFYFFGPRDTSNAGHIARHGYTV